MTIQPLVSIIIPTYRRPALLRRAILSALSQDGPSLQVCVYDNNSGDETRSVVEEIAGRDPRLKYFCHSQNIGAQANFQFGLARVSTPFFSFLSDDDLQLPGFLGHAIRGFEKFPEAMFWGGVTVCMTPQGQVFDAKAECWPDEGLFSPPEGLVQLIRQGVPIWTGVVMRREVVDEIGLLDHEVGGPSDFDYLIRIAARKPYILSRHPAAIFMLNPASFSQQEPLSSFWPGWLKMIENVRAVPTLDLAAQASAIELLDQNARRMLFRRAANAISRRRYDFALQSAAALGEHYGLAFRSRLIRILAFLCGRISAFQMLYSFTYDLAEQAIVRKKEGLQQRYSHLRQFL